MSESQTKTPVERFDFGFYLFARPGERTEFEVKRRIWYHLMEDALQNLMNHWSPEAVFTLASMLYALESAPGEGVSAADLINALRAEIDSFQPAAAPAEPIAPPVTPTAPPPIELRPRIAPPASPAPPL